MSRRNSSIQGLLMAVAMMAAVLLSAGCRAAVPVEVEQPSPTTTTNVSADTPSPAAPAATETKPIVSTETDPIRETEAPRPPATESKAAIAIAVAYLAQHLAVAEQDILVQVLEAVDWPDASLGCPQPGMVYAQVITPGYRVLLEVDAREYEIHTGGGQTAVLCEQEGSSMTAPPLSGTIEAGLDLLIGMTIQDLAGRLSITEGEIEVLEAIAVVWPDASLGCPQPGMRYKQVPMDGALIRLQAQGKTYEYHSGGGRDPFLCEQPLKIQKDSPPQIDLLQLTPGSPGE